MWYIVCIAFLSPHALCFKSSHLFLHFAFSELLDTWRVAQHCNQHEDRRPGLDVTRPLPEAGRKGTGTWTKMIKKMYCISINEFKWIWMTCFIFRFVPPFVSGRIWWFWTLNDGQSWSLKLSIIWGDVGGFLAACSHAYQWSLGPFEIVRKVKGCKKSLLLHNSYDFTSIMRDAANLSCQYRTLTGLWVSCIFSKLLCDNWLENRLHFPWTICNICRCAFWALLFPKYTVWHATSHKYTCILKYIYICLYFLYIKNIIYVYSNSNKICIYI